MVPHLKINEENSPILLQAQGKIRIVAIDAETNVDEIQYGYATKTLHQLGTERHLLSLKKGICKNLQLTSSHSHHSPPLPHSPFWTSTASVLGLSGELPSRMFRPSCWKGWHPLLLQVSAQRSLSDPCPPLSHPVIPHRTPCSCFFACLFILCLLPCVSAPGGQGPLCLLTTGPSTVPLQQMFDYECTTYDDSYNCSLTSSTNREVLTF